MEHNPDNLSHAQERPISLHMRQTIPESMLRLVTRTSYKPHINFVTTTLLKGVKMLRTSLCEVT